MQNNNNRKILNSKKDSLPGAEVQSNAFNFRMKKSATSIKRNNNYNSSSSSSNNKSYNTNINNHTNAINSNHYNAKTTTASNFHNKLFKSNRFSKHLTTSPSTTISSLAALSSSTLEAAAVAAATAASSSSNIDESKVDIPQNCGSKETTENSSAIVKTKKASATSLSSSSSSSRNEPGLIKLSSSQIEAILSSQHSTPSHKARHHNFNGKANLATTINGKLSAAAAAAGSRTVAGETVSISTSTTKKSLLTPIISKTPTTPSSATSNTSLAILQKQTTALAVIPSSSSSTTTTTLSTTPSTTSTSSTKQKSTPLSVTSNGNGNTNSTGASTIGTGNNCIINPNNKSFQIPSDILDDLASRFVINVPDMELSNLIRICFQIELAHWFYLDFFCTGIDEDREVLKPVGMKYFAMQLFQHIPFLSEHLPKIDTVLEDWKNYKLAVPTFGAILISEDLQYCLLVQSYFAKSSWGFPKGKVNETEDPEHCATREVFEETGYDITGLILPKDYIEAVINDQYTRLYIVCNVSLETVFEPRTRNEIRCCVWFPIDSLPNNKNDAISKAKLGQNANSFFMILPFVKRLKKWVNEKRAKAGINDTSNNGGAAVAVGGGAPTASVGEVICSSSSTLGLGNTTNGNNMIINGNGNGKTYDRRKYSTNGGGCTNNGTTAVNGTLLKSPSLGFVGEMHFIRSNANANANSGKKNRQQQYNKSNNNNTNNNSKGNIVSGCFELNDSETRAKTTTLATTTVTPTTTGGANAVAASAAAIAGSKRQRHKSMGDLDNVNAFNNPNINGNGNGNGNKNSNSCSKNIYISSSQFTNSNGISGIINLNANGYYGNTKRNSMQCKKNVTGSENHNGASGSGNISNSRRQLFHSHSQNDGVVRGEGGGNGTEQIIKTLGVIQQQQQQQRDAALDNLKFGQQSIYLTESASVVDEQSCNKIRQREKSQCDKACNSSGNNNNDAKQKQFQVQTAKNFYCKKANTTTTSRPNLQRQSSLVVPGSTTISKMFSKINNDTDANDDKNHDNSFNGATIGAADAVGGSSGELKLQQRHRRYTTTTAPTMSLAAGNEIIAWNAATKTSKDQSNINNKSVFAASDIETRLIEEQKLIRQWEGVKSQKPIEQKFTLIQQQTQQQLRPFSFSQQQQQQQPQPQPLQHSASSPGLATWKNFSFTKNLISNVFL